MGNNLSVGSQASPRTGGPPLQLPKNASSQLRAALNGGNGLPSGTQLNVTGPNSATIKVPGGTVEYLNAGSGSELEDGSGLIASDRYSSFLLEQGGELTRGSPLSQLPVGELLPDLTYLNYPIDVVNRFAADVTLLEDQLALGLPVDGSLGSDLPPELARVFELFVGYAERFVALKTGEAETGNGSADQDGKDGAALKAKLPLLNSELLKALDGDDDADHDAATQKFLALVKDLGFSELSDARTQQTALEQAKQLLTSSSLAEFNQRAQQFQASSAASQQLLQQAEAVARNVRELDAARAPTAATSADGRVELDGASVKDVHGQLQSFGVVANRMVVGAGERQEHFDSAGQSFKERLRRGKLGANSLWNVLHTFRGKGEDTVQRRDTMNRLALTAILVLTGVMALVVVLVTL